MLPEVLSSRACSLRAGEDKLAVSIELELDGTAVKRVSFHRSRVRSDKRLTYREVDEIFAGRGPRRGTVGGRARGRAGGRPRALAGRRDAVEIGSPEPNFEFDSDGHVTGCAMRSRRSRTA